MKKSTASVTRIESDPLSLAFSTALPTVEILPTLFLRVWPV